MSAYTQIAYEVADHVATITLDRPHALNAYTVHMQQRAAYARDAQRMQRVKRLPGVRHVRRLHSSQKARRWLRPIWPLFRLARRRLLR